MILVKKIEPKNIPIVAPPSFTLIVNMKIARELQKYPPLRVVKIAEVVQ
jgi:putative ABC transport system substrate-binding protein